MKSIMFWLLVMSCGVVKADVYPLQDTYHSCFSYQFSELNEEYEEAEYYYNSVSQSLDTQACKDGRIDAVGAYHEELRILTLASLDLIDYEEEVCEPDEI